jgi:benzoate-CoA ligase family protein
MTMESLFQRLYPAERAELIAVCFEQREITYGELRQATLEAGARLQVVGVAAGDRVGLLLNDSPEFVASFVAVISLGAIAVPINLALGREEQIQILKDCGARSAVTEVGAAENLFRTGEAETELRQVLVLQRGRPRTLSLPTGIQVHEFNEAASHRPEFEFSGSAVPDADAFILYTSGSTGEPKGAVHRQEDIFYTYETFCREVLNLRADDRLFSSSRLPFAYGLGNSFTFPLLSGCASVLCREKPVPEVVSRIFSEYRPTIFFGVPVVCRMLLDHYRAGNELDTSSLRLCVSAGEALPAQLGEDWEKTFRVPVLDGIGSTEMLHMFMSNHEGDVRYGSSGKLLKGYDARLVDHEGAATPAGEAGNLWIRGESSARSYWQRPEISAETFVDGWTRTGDLYRKDADGFWWHMGRTDDCFKPTGQWVSPIEVESVLVRHEAVHAAAVVEGFDEDGLSCVCAFVVIGEGDPQVAEGELRTLCGSSLPRFKQPRRYLFVSELPYTATGKVQRFKLREQLRAKRAGQ